MQHAGISDKIIGSLNKIVKDQKEFDMIIDLLKSEKTFGYKGDDDSKIKTQFQKYMDQHFPLEDES